MIIIGVGHTVSRTQSDSHRPVSRWPTDRRSNLLLSVRQVVLSACSPYFQSLLLNNPCKHPIIILPRDVRYSDLRHVIEFVYKGEIDVAQEQLDNLLQTADQVRMEREGGGREREREGGERERG